ncbi:MAG: DUF996 domain-containing protein [Candidatus Bathyarchaeota archaeon]|nr:DUF996 domain-containing protein [Candidatus Bathyarchaeota archaeon]
MYPDSNGSAFETNKIIGGIGALLTAIGSFLPLQEAMGIIAVIGLILVLISMRGLSITFNNECIYRNALYGTIFGVIATGIGVALVSVLLAVFTGGHIAPFGILISIAAAILGLIVIFIFFLVEAIFYKQAFALLAGKSGEGIFRTGGLLLLIGAVLTIVFVGFVLLFVAWLIIAVGFLSMKTPIHIQNTTHVAKAPPPPPQPSATIPPAGEKKFCTDCGTENQSDAIFCVHCGKKLKDK